MLTLILKFCQNISRICIGFYFFHDTGNISVFVYNKRCPYNAHADLSVELLFLPYPVSFGNGMFRVREKGEWQIVLFRKLFVRSSAISAYADYFRAFFTKLIIKVRKCARLSCTSGSVVFGIKIQNDFFCLYSRKAILAFRSYRAG